MILKPIKVSAFRLKFAVLNRSVTLDLFRGREEAKVFNVKLAFRESTTTTTMFRSKARVRYGKPWLQTSSYDRYTSNQSSLACNLSSEFHVFCHNSSNFILYCASHEVNLCWLPDLGSHVTNRNQGAFSRQDKEPWERG